MDYRPIILVALFSCAGVAHAGYAQLAPPPTWSVGTATFGNTYTPAANDAKWLNSTVRTNPALNVGGRAITVPASLRISAANAPRFLAARVGTGLAVGAGSLFIPGLTVAALLALPAVVEWWSQSPYKWDSATQTWTKTIEENCDPSGTGCREYVGQIGSNPERVSTSKETVCRQLAADIGYAYEGLYSDGCLIGGIGRKALQSRVVPKKGGKVVTVPFEEVKPFLDNIPLPAKLPNIVWPFTWPVDQPVINPDPAGNPRPLFVPTGDPVKNPKYDPSAAPGPDNLPWNQPGVRITPRPTASEPWRVDVTPIDRPQDGPDPLPEPEPGNDPTSDPKDQPKPEEQQSICEKHPDILACQILKDSGEKPEIEKKDFDFDFTPETGFSGSATCPAPVTVNASGMQLSFSWQPFCNSLSFAKPIILALAWLSAAFIMLGAKEQ